MIPYSRRERGRYACGRLWWSGLVAEPRPSRVTSRRWQLKAACSRGACPGRASFCQSVWGASAVPAVRVRARRDAADEEDTFDIGPESMEREPSAPRRQLLRSTTAKTSEKSASEPAKEVRDRNCCADPSISIPALQRCSACRPHGLRARGAGVRACALRGRLRTTWCADAHRSAGLRASAALG